MSPRPYFPVRAVMTPDPILIDGLATVSQAVELMRANGVSSLIINRRNETDEYGVVVITDIAQNVIDLDRHPDRVSVYEIMSKPVLCVEAEMDIRYALRMLNRFSLSRALVVEKGTLVGVVTQRELVFAIVGGPSSALAGATAIPADPAPVPSTGQEG